MILKLICFDKTGRNVVKESSATQISSQMSLPTFLSFVFSGEYNGGRFETIFPLRYLHRLSERVLGIHC